MRKLIPWRLMKDRIVHPDLVNSVIYCIKKNENEDSQLKRKDFNFKMNGTKKRLEVIFETTKLEKLNVQRKSKKPENQNQLKSQINGKPVQSKNFISINKKDAFDPHCLAGRNANLPLKNEEEKPKEAKMS